MSDINVQTFSGKVKVSNDLTVTTNVHADYFKGDGSLLTNLPSGSGGVWNTNSDNEIYFISSNVGISNADPGHNLSVGSNLYVDDDGSNVLVVTGNVKADYFVGDGSLLTGLSGSGGVWSTNGDGEIYFINSNVGISNADPGHNLSVGSNLYIDDDGSNVLVVTGNVKADYFSGDGSLLTNLPSGSGGVWSTNGDGEIYFINSNVGISNADPGHNLSVGSNLYVDDDGLNVLVVDGNVAAESINIGGVSIVPSYPLSSVTDTGNTTPHTIEFTNAETGIVVDSNIVVAGNVTAAFLYGDASNVTGIASNLHQIVENGNVTSNTVQFSNATTGLVTTANVSVGKDLTVSGNVSDLNVVSNVNLLHTANTASIKLNSNVVTEFPRSKKLIKYPRVAMTQNDESGTSGYVASASSTYTNYNPYEAFDNEDPGSTAYWSGSTQIYNTNGTWGGGTAAAYTTNVGGVSKYGEWIQIQLPNKIKYNYSKIKAPSPAARQPRDGYILGSNDTTGAWTILHRFEDVTRSSLDDLVTYTPSSESTQFFQYFRLVIETINDGGLRYPGVNTWDLYGIPEYDPDADGVDVVVKSVPNVPNTDWLEVYYDAKDLADGAVSTVNDLKPTGTANNGVANGNLSVSDGAFTFDGSGDYISSTVTTTTGAFTHTFAFWMNIPSSASTTSALVGFGTNSSDEASAIRFDGAENLRWYFFGNDIKFTTPNVRDKWVHVVGTYDGGNDSGLTVGNVGVNRKIFINTKETTVIENIGGSAGSDALNLLSTSHAFRVGSDLSNGNTLTGKIANVRLFNRVLTQDDIYQLYAYQKEDFGHGDLGMTLKAGRLGIGTSEPKAMLDVRGVANFERVGIGVDNPGKTLDVNGTTRSRKNAGWKSGTFDSTGVNMGPLADGTTDGAQIGWEFHVTFSAATSGSRVEIYGAYKHSGPLYAANEKWTFRFKEGVGTPDYSNYAELVNETESNADTYYAVIRVVNSIYNNTNVVAARHHFMSHSVGCHRSIGATIWQAQGYIDMGGESIDDRFNYLRLTSSSGNIKGQWTVFPITT